MMRTPHRKGASRTVDKRDIVDTETYQDAGDHIKGNETWMKAQQEKIPVDLPSVILGPNASDNVTPKSISQKPTQSLSAPSQESFGTFQMAQNGCRTAQTG